MIVSCLQSTLKQVNSGCCIFSIGFKLTVKPLLSSHKGASCGGHVFTIDSNV